MKIKCVYIYYIFFIEAIDNPYGQLNISSRVNRFSGGFGSKLTNILFITFLTRYKKIERPQIWVCKWKCRGGGIYFYI